MSQNRYALVIGNTSYKDPNLLNLSSPEKDVKELARLLEDPNVGFFDEVEMKLNASSSELRKDLGEFYKRRRSDDLLLVYFSGHGLRDNKGKLYLATSDTEKDNFITTSIPTSLIKDLLEDTKSRRQIIILDCCFSGAFKKGTKSSIIKKIPISQEFKPTTRYENGYGIVVVTASDSIQPALEGKLVDENIKYSLFTNYLIEGLKGGKADIKNNGLITIDELYDYVFDKITKVTNDQTPSKWSEKQQGNLLIARNEKLKVVKKPLDRLSENDIPRHFEIFEKYIFPPLSSLNQTAFLENLNSKIRNLKDVLANRKSSSVALLGLTGVGKTSLLNSILHSNVGVSGGGGAQSAASLVVSYQENQYSTDIRYLNLNDLREYAELVKINAGKKDLFKRPDEQSLPESLKNLFDSIGIDEKVLLNNDLEISDLPSEISDKIEKGETHRSFNLSDFNELKLFIKDHTNSRQKLWPITEEVVVKGPFKGVNGSLSITDLPGLGDLNKLRIEKAKAVLRKANQIIVVLGERGFTDSIRDMLGETQIISGLLTNPEIPQILFVGTQLDNTNINDSEIEELELDYDCEDSEIIEARFNRWKKLIKEQWREMLSSWSAGTQVLDIKNNQSIDNILQKSSYIPSSPVGYLCLNGLERDRKGRFKEIFPIEKGAEFENTGIPQIRDAIYQLSLKQEEIRAIQIKVLFNELISSTYNICEPVVESLSKDLKSKLKSKEKLQSFYNTTAILKSQVSDFSRSEIMDNISLKLEKVEKIILEGWKDLDSEAISKLFKSHLNGVSFQTTKAALKHDGAFQSKGKAKVKINIPQKIGRYVVEPVTSFVFQSVLQEFIRGIQDDLNRSRENLVNKLEVELVGQLIRVEELNTLKIQLDSILLQFKNNISELIIYKAPNIVDFDVSKMAYQAIGMGFNLAMEEAVNVAKGKGARQKAIDKLIESSVRLLPDIIKSSSELFSNIVLDSLNESVEGLYNGYSQNKSLLFEQIIETSKLTYEGIDNDQRENVSKRLILGLQKLPKTN